MVLAGRCYENESVPYKALDGVVDDLSRYLGSIPVERRRRPAAARRVGADASVSGAAPGGRRCRRLRGPRSRTASIRFASGAERSTRWRALLRRLAARRSLVIWIDDLQWADADSMVLLEELLGPPSPPAMLTLLSFRSEEMAAKPFLQALLDRAGPTTSGRRCRSSR